jgi:hypothetical protein
MQAKKAFLESRQGLRSDIAEIFSSAYSLKSMHEKRK